MTYYQALKKIAGENRYRILNESKITTKYNGSRNIENELPLRCRKAPRLLKN
jgi:hypothetical protein